MIQGVKITAKSNLTHLVFVNDVMMFGAALFSEWKNIKELLLIFFQASRMERSDNKYVLLSFDVEEVTVKDMSSLFSFQIKDINEGLKYLGYFINPNRYKVSHWRWLIQKFEKKNNNWTYRWLSMGDRLTLIKVILEGIYVYWLCFSHIPSSVLNILKKKMFSFIW